MERCRNLKPLLRVLSRARVAQSAIREETSVLHQHVGCQGREWQLGMGLSDVFSYTKQRDFHNVYPKAIAEGCDLQYFKTPARLFATSAWGEQSDEETEDSGESVESQAHRKCPTSPRPRNHRERMFDDIIEREKKLKIVLKIKDLVVGERGRAMSLQDLGRSKNHVGFKGNVKVIAFLKKFPGVFDVHETSEFGKLPWFRLTPEANKLYEEEVEIRKGMNAELVTKLRKILMMSSERCHLLKNIAHFGADLGLPNDFRKKLVYRYPKYFRVIEPEDDSNGEGRILELVKWSNRLAVTEAEKKTQEFMQANSLEKLPRLDINIPKRYRLSNKDKYIVYKFHELKCPSPYQDSSSLHPASAEAEKRAVLLIQELLSLTLEKRILVDHLTHFRKEFKFSNQVRGLLIRHPEHFYVSIKGSRDTVFLREAFEDVHVPGQRQEYILKEKHPLVLNKEKFAALMETRRITRMTKSADPLQNNPDFTQERLISSTTDLTAW